MKCFNGNETACNTIFFAKTGCKIYFNSKGDEKKVRKNAFAKEIKQQFSLGIFSRLGGINPRYSPGDHRIYQGVDDEHQENGAHGEWVIKRGRRAEVAPLQAHVLTFKKRHHCDAKPKGHVG